MSDLNLSSTIELNNGVKIPILAYGTFRINAGFATRDAVLSALQAGLRHIDTGSIYENEVNVGEAIEKSGVPREDVFITAKLWNADQGFDNALKAFETSLDKFKTDYIDLYLIHWPVRGKRMDSWKALEQLYHEKKCRAIGVSNYTIKHLEELLSECTVMPTVNQVEFSPYTYQKELLDYCNTKNIQIAAYSPLTKSVKLNDERLVAIAERYSKSTAQLLIRWGIQKGLVVVFKTSKKPRIFENPKVFDFEISPEDMATLDSFDENLRTGWDPHDREWA